MRVIRRLFRYLRWLLICAALVVSLLLLLAQILEPKSDRNWEPDWERQPRVVAFDGTNIKIENFRDFRWEASNIPSVSTWKMETFNLNDLVAADLFIIPLSDSRSAAHTMLSFEFSGREGTKYVVISMEARREKDEPYATWRGLLNQYELTYVIGSEEDLLGLRAVVRGNELYRYRLNATPNSLRNLFTNMALTAEAIAIEPEFYGTLWNSCTTRIVMHANIATGVDIPISWRYILPGFSDDLAYELDLIGNKETPLSTLRESAKVGQTIRDAYNFKDFSLRLRR